jgi:uncharacterized damage-inducible protein DinB
MTVDTIKLLSRYNTHSNNLMNNFISQLHQNEWDKDLGGYYKSIKGLCSHIYIGDFSWLKRFGLIRSFDYLKNSMFNINYSWDSQPFNSISDYQEKRNEMDSIFNELVEEINQDDLTKILNYKNWKNEDQSRNFGGVILHVFNHQTHHRGMISLYLELLGKQNDFSNLVTLV